MFGVRKAYRELGKLVRGIQQENDQLKVENSKLRELVRWMYYLMDESCAVQHPYTPAPISYDLLMQALARVRELGVEVSE